MYIFFKTVKNYAKGFQLFFKKNSILILKDLYEYLFLKIPAKNSFN